MIGKIELTKPAIGFCGLVVGDHVVNGVSYVNPWLLEDFADLFDEVADRRHFAGMRIDCEGLGMATVVVVEAESVIVVRDDGLAIDDEVESMPEAIRSLAKSIGRNVRDWVDWYGDEGTEPETARKRIDDVIQRLCTAAERLETSPHDAAETLRTRATASPADLTPDEIEMLEAQMRLMCARTRLAPESNVQAAWHVSSVTNDGSGTIRIGVSSDYFEDRRLAFMRPDGTVGVATWCDATNARPVREAFAEWCTLVRQARARRREMDAEKTAQ